MDKAVKKTNPESSLAKITRAPFSRDLMERAATLTGEPIAILEIAAAGDLQQIRHMEETAANGALIIRLAVLAQSYGAYRNIDEDVLEECVRLVKRKFSFLGIEELTEAYRLAAAGEIEAQKMYGGAFNASQLGSVLTAYCQRRNKVLAKAKQLLYEARQAKIEKEKAEKWQRDYDANFLRNCRAASPDSYKDIPIHWWNTAKRLGLIRITKEEAEAVYQRARQIEEAEAKNAISQSTNTIKRLDLQKALQPKSIAARAKTTAGRLVVFEWIKAGAPVDQ